MTKKTTMKTKMADFEISLDKNDESIVGIRVKNIIVDKSVLLKILYDNTDPIQFNGYLVEAILKENNRELERTAKTTEDLLRDEAKVLSFNVEKARPKIRLVEW
jgi:hypothetical protein